jgi:hypothetical protein
LVAGEELRGRGGRAKPELRLRRELDHPPPLKEGVVPDPLALLSLPSVPQASPKWVLRRRPRKFGSRRGAEREREQSQAGANAGD